MIKRLIPKNQFARNILTLMTGTSVAQAIPIAISPILTRIYTPDDFGLFSVYIGIASIIGIVATGRYELAILLPEKEEDARDIVNLSIIITICISLLMAFLVFFFGKKVCKEIGKEELYAWLFFLPISTFLTGTYQSLNYWFNRKKDFKQLAKNRVLQSTSTTFSQIPFSLIGVNGIGLLIGTVFGQLITTFTLFKKLIVSNPLFFKGISKERLKKLAYRFSDFPKYDIPTSLLNSASMYAPNILFSSVFGASFAGFYYMTQRVLQAPITLISTSFLDVFREEATSNYRQKGEFRNVFLKTLKWLVLISVVPSIILYFVIEDLFIIVFGKDWAVAGLYAKILIPAVAIRFIVNPLSFAIYIVEKQYFNFFGMLLYFIMTLSAFYFAVDPVECVQILSIVMIVYYVIYLLIASKFARVW